MNTTISNMHDSSHPLERTNARSSAFRLMTLGLVVGPAVFTVAWGILEFINTGYTLYGTVIPSYNPISQPISGLGLGVTAPYMNLAFMLSGALLLVGTIGVLETLKTSGSQTLKWIAGGLLLLSAVGSIVDGIFTLQSGFIHYIGAFLGIGLPILGFPLLGLYLRKDARLRRLGTALLIAGPVSLALAAIFFGTFNATASGQNIGISGLLERAVVTEVLAWFFALGISVRRNLSKKEI